MGLLTWSYRHGLSYTTFSFSDLTVSSTAASLKVTNTGTMAGAEVVQMYIASDPATATIGRPVKELKGFTKVFLQPGEARHVKIPFDRFTTAFWDEEKRCWVCEAGVYRVLLGTSSQKILLQRELRLEETTTWTGL